MLIFLLIAVAAAHWDQDCHKHKHHGPIARFARFDELEDFHWGPRREYWGEPEIRPEPKLKIVERHMPRYRVVTKVAAPVYILPKHGPVMKSIAPKVPLKYRDMPPKVIFKPTPIIMRPAKIMIAKPRIIRPKPIFIHPKMVIIRPMKKFYFRHPHVYHDYHHHYDKKHYKKDHHHHHEKKCNKHEKKH